MVISVRLSNKHVKASLEQLQKAGIKIEKINYTSSIVTGKYVVINYFTRDNGKLVSIYPALSTFEEEDIIEKL